MVDELEPIAAAKATTYSAWGHRKIWALLRADGVTASMASVKRALARQQLLLPVRYQAERRALAKARKAVFLDPPARRNRVWQTDFSEFETIAGGTWQLSPVVDYAAKLAFACHVTATKTAGDAVAAMEAALAEAERLLGFPLLEDCRDPMSGEVHPLILVTDNGSAYKADSFARFIAAHPELAHVRTRYRAPWTNGVVERFNESAKYEHLYREEVAGGHQLAQEVEVYRRLYIEVRPHENLAFRIPLEVYLATPTEPPAPVANFRRSTLGYLEPIPVIAPTPDGVETVSAAVHPAPHAGL